MSSPIAYYQINRPGHSLLGHMSFGVASYDRSKTFYSAVLAPFGVTLTYDAPEDRFLGYGFAHENNSEIINIFERKQPVGHGPGSHICFNAPSRAAVTEFWEAAIANGATDNGKAGFRGEETGPGTYFAAYVIDPDGYRLEAVFQGEEH